MKREIFQHLRIALMSTSTQCVRAVGRIFSADRDIAYLFSKTCCRGGGRFERLGKGAFG